MQYRKPGRHGLQVPVLCLGTMTLGLQGITSAIIGAGKPEQLDANLDALDVKFDAELTDAREEAWWSLPLRRVMEGYR